MLSLLIVWPTWGVIAWKSIIFDVYSILPLVFSIVSMNAIFYLRVSVIALRVFRWGIYYIGGNKIPVFFFVLLTRFVISMLLLILRESYLVIFLGWEGLGITSFLLIIFYQNWISLRGGLITLLTNRLGDGVLLISFSYWVRLRLTSSIYQKGSIVAFFLFLLVTLTKRAQIPFTRWLPAAIAAPTPVRALVHSSTLVTAGVWLLVRFRQVRIMLASALLILGTMTLMLASMAALIEVDGKKVVALSTLRQLGLIFISISLGNSLICLFHLLMHAFAKANLFLIVGNFLHIRFSQQDYRQLSSGIERRTIFLVIFVRVFRLRGVVFSRGFFSKDSILLREFNLIGSIFTWLILLRIISLTLAYCLKLIFSFSLIEDFQLLTHTSYRLIALTPRILLVALSIYLGYVILSNVEFLMVFSKRTSGLYWTYLAAGIIVIAFRYIISPSFWGKWFSLQLKLLKAITINSLLSIKRLSQLFSSTFLESNYLLFRLSYSSGLYVQLIRIRYILTWISIVLLLI